MKKRIEPSLLTVSLQKSEKARLQALAKKEQRTLSNLARVLLIEGAQQREQAAA